MARASRGRWSCIARAIFARENWGALAVLAIFGSALAVMVWEMTDEALTEVLVRVSPGRPACERWIEHLRRAGFHVRVDAEPDSALTDQRLHIPAQLAACHTAITVNGPRYVIEGHVPADTLRRLLHEQPQLRGVAVPDTPAGAPGFDGAGPFDVVGFTSDGSTSLYEHRNGPVRTPAARLSFETRLLLASGAAVVALILTFLFFAGYLARVRVREETVDASLLLLPLQSNPEQIAQRLREGGVTSFTPVQIVPARSKERAGPTRGWMTSPAARKQVIATLAPVRMKSLPARRCLIVEIPRANALARFFGFWRARDLLERYRVRHGYRDNTIYMQVFDHRCLYVQPVRQ